MSKIEPPIDHPINHHHREELASALTHGVGAAAALAGGAVLISLAALYGDRWQLSADRKSVV